MTLEQKDEKEWIEIFVAKMIVAKDEGKESFIFDGKEVLVAYAKYVVENYENKTGVKI